MISQEKVLIIDAKYYEHILQENYESKSVHSGNIYQIFTYVKNHAENGKKPVAGMLLYAKTQELIQPDNVYHISGNQISVKTLDLNLPFSMIKEQLEGIVEGYFC